MSVINQALRELERRAATGAQGTLPGRIHAVAGRRAGGLKLAAFASAIVVAAAAGRMFAPAAAQPREPQRSSAAAPVRIAMAPASSAAVQTPEPVAFAAAPLPSTPKRSASRPARSARNALPVARPMPSGTPHDWTLPEAELPEAPPLIAATRTPAPLATTARTTPASGVGSGSAMPAESIARHDRPLAAADRAQNEFLAGMNALRNGHGQEAELRFRAALDAQPAHVEARRALLGMLIEAQRLADAETLLLAGLRAAPDNVSFAMVAARLQAQRGDAIAGIVTLESAAAAGRTHPDFIALHAGLLQRVGKHEQAAERYLAAIALGGQQAVWHIGRGVSLRELGRIEEARASFQRALDLGVLTPELRAYAERQVGIRRAG